MIRAYHRRRGWHAWHVGMLASRDFGDDFPTLDLLMGIAPARVEMDIGELRDRLRLWTVALGSKSETVN